MQSSPATLGLNRFSDFLCRGNSALLHREHFMAMSFRPKIITAISLLCCIIGCNVHELIVWCKCDQTNREVILRESAI